MRKVFFSQLTRRSSSRRKTSRSERVDEDANDSDHLDDKADQDNKRLPSATTTPTTPKTNSKKAKKSKKSKKKKSKSQQQQLQQQEQQVVDSTSSLRLEAGETETDPAFLVTPKGKKRSRSKGRSVKSQRKGSNLHRHRPRKQLPPLPLLEEEEEEDDDDDDEDVASVVQCQDNKDEDGVHHECNASYGDENERSQCSKASSLRTFATRTSVTTASTIPVDFEQHQQPEEEEEVEEEEEEEEEEEFVVASSSTCTTKQVEDARLPLCAPLSPAYPTTVSPSSSTTTDTTTTSTVSTTPPRPTTSTTTTATVHDAAMEDLLVLESLVATQDGDDNDWKTNVFLRHMRLRLFHETRHNHRRRARTTPDLSPLSSTTLPTGLSPVPYSPEEEFKSSSSSSPSLQRRRQELAQQRADMHSRLEAMRERLSAQGAVSTTEDKSLETVL